MSSDSRFYLMSLGHRPALWQDIGSGIKISGLVVETSVDTAVLLLPSSIVDHTGNGVQFYQLDAEQWSDFIRRSDNPDLMDESKIFQRKVRYEVSGVVQQKIWAADGFKCVYCGRNMGEVQLTIDHLVPLELGGANDESNYLSACRRCNKSKGSLDPEKWLAERGISFQALKDYLSVRVLP